MRACACLFKIILLFFCLPTANNSFKNPQQWKNRYPQVVPIEPVHSETKPESLIPTGPDHIGDLPPPPLCSSSGSPPEAPPAKPAFLLGGGLSSLQRVKLPSREELVEFCALRPGARPQSWTVCPTVRIRQFDSYRLHTPSAAEKERMSIPSSIDRINITNLNHLLILCGGYRSVRFTSEVLAIYQIITNFI